MPSKKQRRRRQKERRHEWEYVYVDEEGREVDAEADEEPAPADGKRTFALRAPLRQSPAAPSKTITGPGGRKIEPPSWRRAFRRGLIFAPFMFLTVFLLNRDAGVLSYTVFTVQMLIMFIPFSYLIERMTYRRFARQAEARPRTGSSGRR